MNLGLSEIGNNWKLVIGNFIILFLVQLVLNFNDIFNGPIENWPTNWELCKITLNSLTVTLIFYGFNKFVLNKEN